MCVKFPDEYIDHWAEVYLAHPILSLRGILFLAFLQQPDALLRYHAEGELPELAEGQNYYPLLPRQQAVADRLNRERIAEAIIDEQLARLPEDARVRDGRLIEPLRHHAFPARPSLRRII